MTAEWIEYEVQPGETALEPILVRFGHIRAAGTDAAMLERVWLAPANRVLQNRERHRYDLAAGEKFMIPPRPEVPGVSPREYRFSGSEASLQAACDAIKGTHGAGALEPLSVALDAFTPEYLYGLFENVPFARRHPGGAGHATGFTASDSLTYFVRPRAAEHRDVVPDAAGTGAANAVTVGAPAFDVEVKLDMPNAEYAINTAAQAEIGRTHATFKVKVTKKTAAEPFRTVIRVLKDGGEEYYREEHTEGDWITPGERQWSWDCISNAGGVHKLDTKILRGRLTIQVSVEPTRGVEGKGELHLANRAACADFVNLSINMDTLRVDAEMYMNVHQLAEDWALWVLIPLLLALVALAILIVAGVIAILLDFLFWLWDLIPGNLSEPLRTKFDKLKMMGTVMEVGLVVALIIDAIILIAALGIFAALSLSDVEMTQAREMSAQGIRMSWSRNGEKKVTVGSRDFKVFATGVQDSDRGVRMVVMKPLFKSQRGVNLSMVWGILPVIMKYRPEDENFVENFREIAAHEYGHSVLARDRDTDYSIRHKGTTGGALDQNAGPGATECPATGECDLMVYYRDGTYKADYLARTVALEEDALRLFRIARVEFREA